MCFIYLEENLQPPLCRYNPYRRTYRRLTHLISRLIVASSSMTETISFLSGLTLTPTISLHHRIRIIYQFEYNKKKITSLQFIWAELII